MTTTTRRDFARTLLLAGASAVVRPVDLLALDTLPGALPRSGRRQRVVVVGAGMAGLTAALELVRAGHDVIVLEARTRPGGRVRTIRAPFADGLYAEAGAARIPDIHELALEYVREAGLPLAPFQPSDVPSSVHVNGVSYRSDREDLLRILGCSAEEQAMGPVGAVRHFARTALESVGSPGDPSWPPRTALGFDRVSGSEMLVRLGMTPALSDFFDLGFGILGELSGLDLLLQLEGLFAPKHRIVGGNDLLPRRLAERLGDRVRYGAPVDAIEHDSGGVRVHVSGPGRGGVVEGDRAVVAVPLPLLSRMRLTPGLSAEKARAIARVRYASVTRVFAQVGRRFWEAEGLSGFGVSDHPLEVFDASFGQQGRRGLLTGYLHEDLALAVDAKGPEDGASLTLRMMSDVHPQLPDEIQGTATFSWAGQPWARGAVSIWQPGDFQELYPHVATAEGRLHFAGEHASPWHAWIQGAVHSGVRAALEVNEG